MTEVTHPPLPENQNNNTPVQEITEAEPHKTTEENQGTSNNDPAARLKKKRRKHKKVKPKVDPEQIKQIRREKLFIKREEQWNNRFINDTIPNMFASKTKKKKSELPKRNKSPLQTVYIDKDIARHKLPNISNHEKEETNKNTQKSFNIRTVGGKKEVFRRHKKHPRRSEHSNADERKSVEPKLPIKIQQLHPDKLLIKSRQSSTVEDKLKSKLEERTKINPINPRYKALLLDLINNYNQKPGKQLRTLLQNEINSIGSLKNPYNRIDNMIKERKSLIKGIIETGNNTTLGTYLTFQLASVTLIEQILKFKAKWEEQYFKLGKPKKVQYNFEGSNYLLTMDEEVKQLSEQQPDPFLITKTNKLEQLVGTALKEEEQQERREMMLKIRACELLLIEERLAKE